MRVPAESRSHRLAPEMGSRPISGNRQEVHPLPVAVEQPGAYGTRVKGSLEIRKIAESPAPYDVRLILSRDVVPCRTGAP